MTQTLMAASQQFMSRPADERFASLTDLHRHTTDQRERSRQAVISSDKMRFLPTADGHGLVMEGKASNAIPTHWSFNQASGLAEVPAKLLRAQCEKGLAALAADNLNAGFSVIRDVTEVGILARENGHMELAAATGPRYGRIWNSDVTKNLVDRFGDGVSGDWRAPGMFGKPLDQVTAENACFFSSDRDLFVFMADEINRVELPNRRANMMGSFARGFFIYNSEVGSKTLGLAFFLFDYACCNRIVWGVEQFEQIAIRHTVTAPSRWLGEIAPTLLAYSQAAASPVEAKLQAAQAKVLDNAEAFLSNRFTPKQANLFMAAHLREEDRPVETLWDAVTAVTAYAKTIEHTDTRVELERAGGALLKLA